MNNDRRNNYPYEAQEEPGTPDFSGCWFVCDKDNGALCEALGQDEELTARWIAEQLNKIPDLERQLAEAQAKAELWEKVSSTFRLYQSYEKGHYGKLQWESAVPGEIDESLKDAVRKLP